MYIYTYTYIYNSFIYSRQKKQYALKFKSKTWLKYHIKPE